MVLIIVAFIWYLVWTFVHPTIGSKNSLIFIYFVHRYLPEKKLT